MTLDGFHYQILRVSVYRQNMICCELRERLPDNHGRVFLLMWEYYRRDRKTVARKLMFTGYVFVWSDLKRSELYGTCRALAKPVLAHLEKDSEIWSKSEDYVFDLSEELDYTKIDKEIELSARMSSYFKYYGRDKNEIKQIIDVSDFDEKKPIFSIRYQLL